MALKALKLWSIALGAVFTFFPAVAHAEEEHPPGARYSAEVLRTRIAEAQARVRSISVETRSYDYKEGNLIQAGAYVHRVIAAKAPASLLHISAHGLDNMDWRLDPEAQHAIIGGGRALNVYKVNRAYITDEWPDDRVLPGTLQEELFFHATGIFPLTSRPAPRNMVDGESPAMLTEVAASRLFDRVRTSQERMDGRWCHVLEYPGHTALWIDADRGCATLATENYEPKNRALVWRLECGGHREVAHGVWVPSWIRNIRYDYLARTPELRTRCLLDTRIQIVRADVNTVEDDQFRFVLPPGALRLNGPQETPVQTVPGGEEHLDELVGWSKSTLRDRWDQVSPARSIWSWRLVAWTLCAVMLAHGIHAVVARGRRSD